MKKLHLLISSVLFASSVSAQTISYVHPDAAAPGMAVYSEILGPNVQGNFGPDGLNAVSIELVNPLDRARLIPGPCVTSMDGRLISASFFIPANAPVGPVPFRLRTGRIFSNVDTFYIVAPQHLGTNLPSGDLGAGGAYGTRSRRNTLVVDSLILPAGSFSVSDIDPDPLTPGNQAYLPFTVLSKGPIRIGGELQVDGRGQNGIAGGGGGGGRDEVAGGDGYTGAGGMNRQGGIGSGGLHTSWNGGQSLCGTPGGGGLGDRWFDDQGGGGGTGYPFGTSGIGGTWYGEGGNNPPGGVGGGSGGGERSKPDSSFGGGGGAYATFGQTSGTGGFNGGRPYGNRLIVPFCGGSGGGGGNQFGDGLAGSGGAGGGAIHLLSLCTIEITGTVSARGADGEGTHGVFKGGGGGAGSGGAIALTAPIVSLYGHLSVEGGKGGDAVLRQERGGLFGGDGGRGRIRIVGLLGHSSEDAAAYPGPSPAYLRHFDGTTEIVGTGRTGDSIVVQAFLASAWTEDVSMRTIVKEDGRWSLPCSEEVAASQYISVSEKIEVPSGNDELAEPRWVAAPLVTLTPYPSPLSVDQSVEAGLNIRFSGNSWSDVTLRGKPFDLLRCELYDMLGRQVWSGTTTLDGAGTGHIDVPNSGLSSGSYMLSATNGALHTSKLLPQLR